MAFSVGTGVVAAALGLWCAAWFPCAADRLAERRRPPSVPGPTGVARSVLRRPAAGVSGAMLGVGVVSAYWPSWGGIVLVGVVTMVGVLAAMVDARCHRLPNVLTGGSLVITAAVGIAWAIAGGEAWRLGTAAAGAVVAVAVTGTAWLVGMGLGDVKYAAGAGSVIGWVSVGPLAAVADVLAFVLIASVTAVAWRMGATLRRRHLSGTPWFAFGPFLVAGATTVLLWPGAW